MIFELFRPSALAGSLQRGVLDRAPSLSAEMGMMDMLVLPQPEQQPEPEPEQQQQQQQQQPAMQPLLPPQAPFPPQQNTTAPPLPQAQLPTQLQQPQPQPALLPPTTQARTRSSGYLSRRGIPLNPFAAGTPQLLTSMFEDDDGVEDAAVAQPEQDPPPSASGCLSVSTRIEYSAIAKGETRDVFSLVTVKALETSPEEPGAPAANEGQAVARQPMDVVCVLDVSGSMQGAKLRDVQRAVQFVVGQADPRDRISIVTFNSSAERQTRLQRMNPEGKDATTVAALRLRANGGTSIAAGLDVGLAVMEQRRQRNNVSAIMLLTDGKDGSSRPRLPALLQRAEAARCQIYAFGFGADHDAALLSSIAEQAQTPFTFVEDTDSMGEAFAGAVGGLTSVVAQQVALSLRCLGGVRLKDIHTSFPTQRQSDTQATTTIPDMFAGESRDILVELIVPASGNEVPGGNMPLLEAFARYNDLAEGCLMQTSPATVYADRVEVPQPEQEPDEEVSAQRARVEVTRALRTAARSSDAGDFQDACRVLEETERQITAARSHRMTAPLSEELQDARNRMESRSAWEQGGRAEVRDAMQMHSVQRCTNLNLSAKSKVAKSSKAMYLNCAQESFIERSVQGKR